MDIFCFASCHGVGNKNHPVVMDDHDLVMKQRTDLGDPEFMKHTELYPRYAHHGAGIFTYIETQKITQLCR